jgi:hypothetical protein
MENNKNEFFTITITNTMYPINIAVPNKEYVLQHTKKYGYRCISWYPHYIMTDWVKTKARALLDGDNATREFYDKMKRAGEALHIVYDRMIAEKEDNENILP